ncbi:MAG TPA: GntR family transcriptional regulator [Kineosporiaceae bacterium]|nr:GntR family transcriptional regulator [Kineosporiaceae bacterium]
MTTPTTAWQRVVQGIVDQIQVGQIPIGAKIPSHHQLIQRYGASLGTVKRALTHLQEVGVLQGRQGAGVFVLRQPTAQDVAFTAAEDLVGLTALRAEIAALRERLADLDGVDAARIEKLESRVDALESGE